MKINYISTEDINIVSGGWSGINNRLNKELSKDFTLNYIGPVNPKSFIFEKLFSKLKRIIGSKGNFHFLSDKRLQLVRNIVFSQLNTAADYNFFFGQMPWIKCNFDKKYAVYTDATFPTYLEIYSTPAKFDKKDISRIASLEKNWLQNASHLFFGSNWALNQAEKHYQLNLKNAIVVWVGGNIPVPEKDVYAGGLNFVFISLDFEKKGGFISAKSFKRIKELHPSASLTIIGQKPPESVLEIEGVVYAGLLNKKDPNDFAKFIQILESAFFLIHPTVMDTMGAVIIEAGYYGCPSIAPNSFGIPELIKDTETGVVVKTPFDEKDFSDALLKYIDNKELYINLRKEVKNFTSNHLTWEAVGARITNKLKN